MICTIAQFFQAVAMVLLINTVIFRQINKEGNVKSKLSGMRIEGRNLQWFLEIEDKNQDLRLQLNSLPITDTIHLTSELNDIGVSLSSRNTDMLDHFLWIDECQMELRTVKLRLKRATPESFIAAYSIIAGEDITEEYAGKVEIIDGGISLLEKTREQILAVLDRDYADIPHQITWGRTRWGIKAIVKGI